MFVCEVEILVFVSQKKVYIQLNAMTVCFAKRANPV